MPDDRQRDPGMHPAAPSLPGGRRRLRHLDDAVLDRLLEPEPDQALVGEVTLHATECDPCRNTLEEWTTLFPHLDVVLPRIPRAQAAVGQHPSAPRVVIPDNEPPRPPRRSHRLAWGIVAVLLAVVVVLAWQLFLRPEPTPKTTIAVAPPAPAPAPASAPPADSTPDSAQGPVILTSPAVVVRPAAPADTGSPQASRDRANGLAAGVNEERQTRSTPPVAAPVEREPAPEPEPEAPPARAATSFPRQAPVETQPANGGARESSPSDMANLAPTFRRIELGDGIAALGGTIRTLSGLTPEEAYIAPGRIVPGAQRDRPLVRLAYRTPGGGRLLLDQQRLDPASGSREASIAVSTSASGVTVAQWIDREGFWISLAGHMDQDELLRYANQLQ